MQKKKFRPDLTDYEIYTLIAIERACKSVLPDVEIKPKRKKYIRLEF